MTSPDPRPLVLSLIVLPTVLLAADSWRELDSGLELGVFPVDKGAVTVLRIDPEHWETVALAASADHGPNQSARQWARAHGLTAVINAGMYGRDHSTHTGYFRVGEHVNNGLWNRNDYRQAACWGPRQDDLPPFALYDLDETPEDDFCDLYDVVIQNLRLIKKPGENRWSQQDRKWSEACLGEDARGRMLWIFSRAPHTMHDLNEILLDLPLDLVAAQHLEGGPEAQLWIEPTHLEAVGSYETGFMESDANTSAWPVPNVLGVRRR